MMIGEIGSESIDETLISLGPPICDKNQSCKLKVIFGHLLAFETPSEIATKSHTIKYIEHG